MPALNYIEFRKNIGHRVSKFKGKSEASKLLGHILEREAIGETAQNELLEKARRLAAYNFEAVNPSKSFKAGSANSKLYLAYYFYLHRRRPNTRFLDEVDRLVFDGHTYLQKFKRSVDGEQNYPESHEQEDRLQQIVSELETVSNNLGNRLKLSTQIQTSKSGNYWKIDTPTLRNFFEPIISSDHVDNLIEISHYVINDQIALSPTEFKTSIIECAKENGVIESETNLQWLTAGIQAGIRADGSRSYVGQGSEYFEEIYKENWRFLQNEQGDDEARWLQTIAEDSEDMDFLSAQKESISVRTAEGQKKHLLLDCLLANQSSTPVINNTESVAAHFDQLIEMNCSPNTKAFLKYSKARNQATTGQSESAIQTYFELRDFGFDLERQIEVRYHMINASYALRMPELYGKPDVSKIIRLSPEFNLDEQAKMSGGKLLGFDAENEIELFCGDFDIQPEKIEAKSITEYVRRFNGPAGVKIIYFYHLEQMLRNGSDKKQLDIHYEQIVELLKILSEISRFEKSNTYFTTDVWYPLIFLYSVVANFEHFDLADRIQNLLNSFEGWKFKSRILQNIREEQLSGSFLTLVHKLNCKYVEHIRNQNVELGPEIINLSDNFSYLKFMPALSQTVNYGMRNLGLEYDPMYDLNAQTKRAVSHWNYIVGGGKIHLQNT